MSAIEPARDKITRQLHEAIDRLRADLTKVEIWADALDVFARPIPDYYPPKDLNRLLLPLSRDEASAPTGRARRPAGG